MGGSPSMPAYTTIRELENPKITPKQIYMTVVLQPRIGKEGMIFESSPDFGEGGRNPFMKISQTINPIAGEKIVVRAIDLFYVCNPFKFSLVVTIRNMFDNEKKQVIPTEEVEEEHEGNTNEESVQYKVIYKSESESRNMVEDRNELKVFIPQDIDNVVDSHDSNLYRPTLHDKTLEKFAGQNEDLLNVDASAALELNDGFFVFVDTCKKVLEATEEDIMIKTSDRDESKKICLLNQDLVDRAKAMLEYVIFSKLYYTRFKDCEMDVEMTEDQMNKATREYAQILNSKGYKPIITFILKVDYFLVKPEAPSSQLRKKITQYM